MYFLMDKTKIRSRFEESGEFKWKELKLKGIVKMTRKKPFMKRLRMHLKYSISVPFAAVRNRL
jgi:hypothetical protein